MTSPSTLTVQELADGICLRAGRIAAAQAELLQLHYAVSVLLAQAS